MTVEFVIVSVRLSMNILISYRDAYNIIIYWSFCFDYLHKVLIISSFSFLTLPLNAEL